MAYANTQVGRFLEWGEDDGTVLLSAALTSANDLGGGVIGGAGAANVTYSAAGILLNATASLNFVNHAALTATVKAKLLGGFTMTCWVEVGWIVDTYLGTAAGEHLMGANGGNYFTAVKGNAGAFLQGRSGGTLSATTDTKATGKDTHVRIDMVYRGGTQTEYYIDGLLAIVMGKGPTDATPFSSFIGVGGSTAGVAPPNHRVKNFMLRSIPSNTAAFLKFNHIAMFGHSFAARGDYYSGNNGYINGDALQGNIGECRALPTIHRALIRKGISIPTGKIRDYGVSGTTVSQLATQITTATANHQPLKVVLIQSGTNEVTASTASFASDYPTWVATWQTQIDSFIANGASVILIANVVSTVNAVTNGWNAAIYQTRCNDANVLINTVIANNPSTCTLIDLFTLFGGHSINAADFLADNVHPSDQGHNKIGKEFSSKLLSLL